MTISAGFVALAASTAAAQEDAVDQFRDYLPEQIMALTDDERSH